MIEITKTNTVNDNKVYDKTYTEHKLTDCTVIELRNFLNDLIGQGLSNMKVSVCGSNNSYIHNLNNKTLLFETDELDAIVIDGCGNFYRRI